jgi:hypothetical protein
MAAGPRPPGSGHGRRGCQKRRPKDGRRFDCRAHRLFSLLRVYGRALPASDPCDGRCGKKVYRGRGEKARSGKNLPKEAEGQGVIPRAAASAQASGPWSARRHDNTAGRTLRIAYPASLPISGARSARSEAQTMPMDRTPGSRRDAGGWAGRLSEKRHIGIPRWRSDHLGLNILTSAFLGRQLRLNR